MKGLLRSLSRGSLSKQNIIKQTVPIQNVEITVDGATGVGFGSAVIGDLPEGNILFLGATSYIQFTLDGDSENVVATFDGDYGIGTTSASDGTITNADVNVIASTALGAAVDGVSSRVRGANSTSAIFDNTDGSLELNLNLLIDDASISGDDQVLSAEGELNLVYIVLGDD